MITEHSKKSWVAWAARAVLGVGVVAVLGTLAAGTAEHASALPIERPLQSIKILAEHDPLDASEVNLFETYDYVRDVLQLHDPISLRAGWVPDLVGFDVADTAKLYVDDDKQAIAFSGKATNGAMITGLGVVDVLLTADWDENDPTDNSPVVDLAIKAHNIRLQDFSDLFGDIGAGVSLRLEEGWVVFTNTPQQTLDLSDIPGTVADDFYEPLVGDELLAGGEPFVLTPGANFMADIALDQMPSLDRAVSFAGIDGVNLRVHGNLAVDASVLFDQATLGELAVFDVSGTLDATGPNPPPWLEDRAFTIHIESSDALVPEISISDTVTTLVGGAQNVFRNGFSFDPSVFDGVGAIPLAARFDLLGDFAEPFGIDVPALLAGALPGNLDIGLEVAATVDLSSDNVISAATVAIEVTDPNAIGGPATVRIGLTFDEALGSVVASFESQLDLSAQELVDALAQAVGADSFDLGSTGNVVLDEFGAQVQSFQGSTSIQVSGSIGAFDDVLGFTWLDLSDLTMTLELSDDEFSGEIDADLSFGGKAWTVQIALDAAADGVGVRASLLLGDGETLSLEGLVDLLDADIGSVNVGDLLGGLQLGDLRVTLRAGSSGVGVDVLAQVEVPDLFDATLYLSVESDGGTPTFFVGLRPTAPISLGSIVPVPGLEALNLPNLALVMTNDTFDGVNAADLTPEAYDFLKGVHGCAADKVQPEPVGFPQPANVCTFLVRLNPGVNLVANVALPSELDEIAQTFWMDATRGVQLVGTITPPVDGLGNFGGPGMSLAIELPAIDPPETVDFIEAGHLSLVAKITVENPSISLGIEGSLDVRFRRSSEPATTCEFGELLVGADVVDDEIVHDEYCYDRLRFELGAKLTLSGSGVSLQFDGGMTALCPPSNPACDGWEAPFGLEWLTIRELHGQFAVSVAADTPGFPVFKFGVLGDAIIGGKQMFGSLSLGIKTVPAPPPAGIAAVPQFFGVRGFVSSLGSTDLVAISSAVTGGAPFPVSGMPLFEVRNAEFMFAVEDNPELCLEQGIGIAGELFFVDDLSESLPADPDTPPGECPPFGAKVDPARCATAGVPGGRDDGCFASFFAKIDLTGIRVEGSIGAIDLGPLHFQDARLRIVLTADEQIFLIRGGISIDGLGGGEVAIVVQPTHLQLYGNLEVFGAFQAQVDASMGVGLEAPFDPTFDASFRGVLKTDFDHALEALVDDALAALSDKVDQVRAAFDAVKNAKPSDFTGAVAALVDLVDRNTSGFDFLDDIETGLTDFGDWADGIVETIGNVFDLKVSPPTVKELVDGGSAYVEWGGLAVCGLGDHYSEGDGKCHNDDGDDTGTPFVTCIPPGEGRINDTDDGFIPRCRVTLNIPNLPGISYNGIIADVGDRAADGLGAFLTGVDSFTSGEVLDDLLDRLTGFDAADAFDLQCANFAFGTDDPDVDVAMKLKAVLLGATFGFDVSLDLSDIDVTELVEELMSQLLTNPETITCADALTPPAGVTDASFLQATLEVDDATLTEGDTARLTGAIDGDPGNLPITIDWGEGQPVVVVLAADGSFEATHLYRDDPPGSANTLTIELAIDGDTRASAQVIVANARPVANVSLTPADVDEGSAVSLTISATDVGELDTHTAKVTWGDGSVQNVALPLGAALTHVYPDDNPTGTASDLRTVQVKVSDDDLGVDTETRTVTVHNVQPAIAATTITALNAINVQEAATFTLPIAWSDPGLADTHTVVVAWGDGSSSTVTPAVGTRALNLQHAYADDNPSNTAADAVTVTVTITDDDTGHDTKSATGHVNNVAPSGLTVQLSAATIVERQSVTVSGNFADPGLADTHTIVVSWGNASLSNTVLHPPAGVRTYSATKFYGDNDGPIGFFGITVVVTDDDTGTVSNSGAVVVDNVLPTAAIGLTGARTIGGADTFVVGTGDALGLSTTATDPGSDDLTIRWDFDTSSGAAFDAQVVSRVPGQAAADALPSPNVRARVGTAAVVDQRTTSYVSACRYDLGLTAFDDDLGTVSDSAVVIVVGDETIRRTAGYWTNQYLGKGGGLLSAAQRLCYLRIVDHLSSVFGEASGRPLLGANQNSAFTNAVNILDANKAKTNQQKLDRQLLSMWLAVANGSVGYDQRVDTDGNGTLDRVLSQWLGDIERARPTASQTTLINWANALERLLT